MLSGLHQRKKLKIFGVALALSFAFISTHPVSAIEPTYTTNGSPITHGLDLELTVAPTLQVVIPTSTVSLNLTPNPDPSIPVFASENLTVSVATNNPTGYSLILKADSTNLTNTVADRNGDYSVLSTLTDLEGGYTEETFTVNRWGYRNTNTLLNNTVTAAIPGNYNAFATSSEILSSKFPTNLDQTSLDFAAKIDITQPAGTYELALNFEAVTNVIPGVVTINYEPNGADNPDAMTKQQFEVVSPENLTPNSYAKANYVFIGWNTAKDGSGTNYNNNQLFVPPEGTIETSNIDLILYAQWALAMQAVTTAQCTETPAKVADIRDNTVYTIQRLNDGNCWMMGNLMLGSTEPINLTPDDTNITSNYILPASGTANFDVATGYTNAAINIDSRNIIDSYGSRYGTYYNYCAASAGQICMDSNPGYNATQDICPAGWRLPIGKTGNEIQALMNTYGIENNAAGATILQGTLNFPLAGSFYDGAASNHGTVGNYWLATYFDDISMNVLGFGISSVTPQGYLKRSSGRIVRCIMKEKTISDITYMQDVTPTIAANTPVGMEATLKDNRDQEEYLIGKLADGKLWMLDNLRLGGTSEITLTPENTNIASNWTLPASGTANFTSSTGYTTAAINTSYKNNTTTSYGNGSGKVGVYYNYCAASAGTYCYAGGASAGNASYDICPKGWRMPTGGSSGEYQVLYAAYSSSATNFRAALSTPLSGGFVNASQYNLGSGGYFWSPTYVDTSSMRSLVVNSSNVSPNNGNVRYRGFSVRCVAK